jgi:hypothetical protein
MAPLFTRHDPFHVHKVLGACALGHFAYRIVAACGRGASSGLQTDPWFPVWVGLHGLLSVSSFLFKVPRNRVVGKPMMYPEFHAHSVAFALRSLMVMCLIRYPTPEVLRPLTVFGTMLAADHISLYIGDRSTTMRDMPYPAGTHPWLRCVSTWFYSISQVMATLNMLTATTVDSPFLVLFPIQLAALLKTLVRKSLIGAGMWHLLYSLALGVNYVHALRLTPSPEAMSTYLGCTVTFCMLRFLFDMNKYVSWLLVMRLVYINNHA